MEHGTDNSSDCEKCRFDSVWLTNTDLADVVSHSPVVDDVQSIFDRVVVALSPLEGLFVTQLNVQSKNQVQHSQIYTMLPHFSFINEGSITSSLSLSVINSTHKALNTIIIMICLLYIILMNGRQQADLRRWTGSRISLHGSVEACQRWQCICASSSHTVIYICSADKIKQCIRHVKNKNMYLCSHSGESKGFNVVIVCLRRCRLLSSSWHGPWLVFQILE